jgi:ABC-2 type transport system permease protein
VSNLFGLYIERSKFEIRTTLRDKRTVMFSMFLPIFLMVIFGSLLGTKYIGHTHVLVSQYIVAGLLASGLLYSAFQQLAIAVPEERSNGTLKRLRGSPMPPSVYFVGKLAVSSFIYLFQVILLLGLGHILYKIALPPGWSQWLTLLWVSALGLLTSSLLGLAFSSLAKDGRSASALAAPLVLFFQFTSGVYFVFTQLPSWMQHVAAVFPLKWLAQAMRSVFLPANFASAESAHSFELPRTALVLAAWCIIAGVLCARTFRWLPKGSQ